MTGTLEFCSVLCATMIWMCHGEPGPLPPPTELTYTWLDPLTLNVSWKDPVDLPDDSKVHYEVKVEDAAGRTVQKFSTCTHKTHVLGDLLTEKNEYTPWNISVRSFESSSCEGRRRSATVTKTIKARKPNAEVVEDFKCYIYKSHLTCSWKPVNPSLELFYRLCDQHEASIKTCNRTYASGDRMVCYIEDKEEKLIQQKICMIATTEDGLSTFKIEYALTPPKVNITDDGSHLILKMEEIEVAAADCWKYNICYSECDTRKPCQEFSEYVIKLPYDNRCRYEFKYEAKTSGICVPLNSDWSDVVTYGANKPDMTMTVVFIVVPVVLSACVILACYCFRRHSNIICPTIPDPSAIFKEMMMMNGNKDVKPISSLLYSPEEEEQCKITLVADDSDLHQNS